MVVGQAPVQPMQNSDLNIRPIGEEGPEKNMAESKYENIQGGKIPLTIPTSNPETLVAYCGGVTPITPLCFGVCGCKELYSTPSRHPINYEFD